ncbi:MAG: energy-dependent translational throttle protein EttA, partial [Planctomycetes bacterium]|nr:energy-dependent translational throttle protein EttA [Planctomycetota bacterium]
MSEQYIFTIERLSKAYGKREVLKNIWLAFYPGAKIGVIGSNGAGKSSLLRVMALEDKDFLGTARLTPGFTIGHVPQEPRLTEDKDVKGNIEEAVVSTRSMLTRFEEISNKLAEPLDANVMEKLLNEMGTLQEKIDACNAWELDRQLEIAMDAMRLPPPDFPAKTLSGGERRRVALCKVLLQKPDLLLLDEPTNHLDAESVAWLERHLQEYTVTVVAVTHDRYFLDNVAQWILELDRGEGIPWKGNYSSWLEQKKVKLEKEERTENARRKALERELEWARMAPRARVAKSKARLAAYEKLAAQEVQEDSGELRMQIPPGPHLGDLVVRAENVKKGYGDNLLMEDLNFDLPRGGIVGIIGPNGAGKTTLFRMITGEEKPDGGTLRIGETVVLSYVDQSRETLVGDRSVW